MRVLVLLPLGVIAAGIGLWAGWPRAGLDVSAAISATARHHARVTGGDPTDCVGQPSSRQGVALVVTCTHAGQRHIYSVDPQGRLIETPPNGGQNA